MNYFLRTLSLLLLPLYLLCSTGNAQETLQAKHVQAILYTGNAAGQPLVVGLGGSEGGNAWTSDRWAATRNRFLEQGYAFLAIGYFGVEGAPQLLEKVEIEDVYHAIKAAGRNNKVDLSKIAIIGGSRGADLALLVASYHKDISCVVGLSSSHAVFPGNTSHFTTSSWTYQGKELPYVPVNEAAVPYMMKRELRHTFEAMLQDTVAESKALIPVEKINGPVLLLSGNADEICPSSTMSEKMIARLKHYRFKHAYEHVAYEGGHSAPLQHFDKVFDFLRANFYPGVPPADVRK